jgi:hypothetical protein
LWNCFDSGLIIAETDTLCAMDGNGTGNGMICLKSVFDGKKKKSDTLL